MWLMNWICLLIPGSIPSFMSLNLNLSWATMFLFYLCCHLWMLKGLSNLNQWLFWIVDQGLIIIGHLWKYWCSGQDKLKRMLLGKVIINSLKPTRTLWARCFKGVSIVMGPSRIVHVATWCCDRWFRGVIRSISWMASGVARVEDGRLSRVQVEVY
jgi:hypothetical protein